MAMTPAEAHITVNHLTMAYGSFIIQRDLSFTVRRGDIFIIMGGSGSGKSSKTSEKVTSRYIHV